MPVSHFNESRLSIVFPVSNSISNHKSFEVRLKYICDILILNKIVVNSQGKLRYINTSVGFTSNVKVIVLDFREFLEKIQDSNKVIISGILISPFAFCFIRAERESNISWAF
jgi:hypothetical protein